MKKYIFYINFIASTLVFLSGCATNSVVLVSDDKKQVVESSEVKPEITHKHDRTIQVKPLLSKTSYKSHSLQEEYDNLLSSNTQKKMLQSHNKKKSNFSKAMQSLRDKKNAIKDSLAKIRSNTLKAYSTKEYVQKGSTFKSIPKPEKSLFHAVYVASSKESWYSLWVILQNNKVKDKWRGYNKKTGVYFIYVGSYSKEIFAKNRQKDLASRLNVKPNIVTAMDMLNLRDIVFNVNNSQNG